MQTVLKLNELPARHCPRGVGKEKSPCGSFISLWVLLVLLLPHGTASARDQNGHLNLGRLNSFSPPSSCLTLFGHRFGGAHKPGEKFRHLGVVVVVPPGEKEGF